MVKFQFVEVGQKWNFAVLLGFGLKESEITLNIMKVGVQSYIPNAYKSMIKF